MANLFYSLSAEPGLSTFVQYLTAFCSQPEEACDVLSCKFVTPIVCEKFAKFCDPHLNSSREIQPEAIIFDSFCAITADWKQLLMSYPVWLQTRSVWMSMENLVILAQTILKIYEPSTL